VLTDVRAKLSAPCSTSSWVGISWRAATAEAAASLEAEPAPCTVTLASTDTTEVATGNSDAVTAALVLLLSSAARAVASTVGGARDASEDASRLRVTKYASLD